NDALKIAGTPHREAISRIEVAMSSVRSALSITQGPRMNASGLPPPTATDPMRTGFTALFYPLGNRWLAIRFLHLSLPARSPIPNPELRMLPRWDGHVCRNELPGLMAIAGFDEAREQRVRPERLRLELGMKLNRDKPRVRWKLRDLDELPVR